MSPRVVEFVVKEDQLEKARYGKDAEDRRWMGDFAQGVHRGWEEEDMLPFSIPAVGKNDLMLLNCHRAPPIITCYL